VAKPLLTQRNGYLNITGIRTGDASILDAGVHRQRRRPYRWIFSTSEILSSKFWKEVLKRDLYELLQAPAANTLMPDNDNIKAIKKSVFNCNQFLMKCPDTDCYSWRVRPLNHSNKIEKQIQSSCGHHVVASYCWKHIDILTPRKDQVFGSASPSRCHLRPFTKYPITPLKASSHSKLQSSEIWRPSVR